MCGDAHFGEVVLAAQRDAMLGQPWSPALVEEIRAMRGKLEASAGPRNLKRGPGGIVDVEFSIQLLQLKYGRARSAILTPNTWDALDALEAAQLLPADAAATLRSGYSFLRLVEARLRIVTDRPLAEIPEEAEDRAKLARRMGFDSPEQFLLELKRVNSEIRSRYEAIAARERNE